MQIKSIEILLRDQLRFLQSEARTSVQWLMEYYTGKDAFFVQLNPEAEVDGETLERLQHAVAALKKGEPLQYVLHESWFYGQAFYVDNRVLIPRPETEELVQWMLQDHAPDSTGNLLDVCTGSGCIALSFVAQRRRWKGMGIDGFASVLDVARINAEKLRLPVEWRLCDVLGVDFKRLGGEYDVIVSNPPYVMQHEQEKMPDRVKKYEPHAALFVPDEDPLCFYRVIADYSIGHLRPDGALYLEINEKLGAETLALLGECGFTEVELRQDMQGKDRMIKAKHIRR